METSRTEKAEPIRKIGGKVEKFSSCIKGRSDRKICIFYQWKGEVMKRTWKQ